MKRLCTIWLTLLLTSSSFAASSNIISLKIKNSKKNGAGSLKVYKNALIYEIRSCLNLNSKDYYFDSLNISKTPYKLNIINIKISIDDQLKNYQIQNGNDVAVGKFDNGEIFTIPEKVCSLILSKPVLSKRILSKKTFDIVNQALSQIGRIKKKDKKRLKLLKENYSDILFLNSFLKKGSSHSIAKSLSRNFKSLIKIGKPEQLKNILLTSMMLGRIKLKKRKFKVALKIFSKSQKIIEYLKLEKNALYVETLMNQAAIALTKKKMRFALGLNLHALEIVEKSEKLKGSGLDILLNSLTGYNYALINQLGLSASHYKYAELILKSNGKALRHPKLNNVFLQYNLALYYTKEKKYKQALNSINNCLDILSDSTFGNSIIHRKAILQSVKIYFELKDLGSASSANDRLFAYHKLFGKSGLTYAIAAHNRASLYKSKGKRKSSTWFRKASQSYKKSNYYSEARKARSRKVYFHLVGEVNPLIWPNINSTGFTAKGDKIVKSYAGGFNISKHSATIRARTYGGRLDDTNVFIKDLLGKSNSKQMKFLRRKMQMKNVNRRGRGLLFIDIGPAIANITDPAVTSVAVAKQFNQMDVVALDLPNEVKFYKKRVLASAKRRLQALSNIHILPGDGIASLKDQFEVEESWYLKDRSFPLISDKELVIVRAANSIDIYFSWKKLRPALKKMASDFKGQNLLIFFNRVILWKPKGEDFLKLVGKVSIRGFYHNQRSLNRKGQKAYFLSSIIFH